MLLNAVVSRVALHGLTVRSLGVLKSAYRCLGDSTLSLERVYRVGRAAFHRRTAAMSGRCLARVMFASRLVVLKRGVHRRPWSRIEHAGGETEPLARAAECQTVPCVRSVALQILVQRERERISHDRQRDQVLVAPCRSRGAPLSQNPPAGGRAVPMYYGVVIVNELSKSPALSQGSSTASKRPVPAAPW